MSKLQFSHMNFLTVMIKLLSITVIDVPMRGKCEQLDAFELAQLKS